MVKNQIFNKTRYQNLIVKQEGRVPLGYDFYGKRTKPDGKGVTVVANTTMDTELFCIRGVEIDTWVENDEVEVNLDNVVIGEMTGLAESDHRFRVYTGAGDYLLQVTGLPRKDWTYHENCLWGVLGTGISSLSFQGMNPATGHPDGTS